MAVNEPIDPRVRLAISQWPDDAPRGAVSTFCVEHAISRKSFYELRKRVKTEGQAAVLEPRTRRPKSSPSKFDDEVKARAVAVRAALESSGLDHGPITVFDKAVAAHGVPQRLLTDNHLALNPSRRGYLGRFVKHVSRRGVEAITGKPYKPTTQGKNERFHQTLFRYLDKQPLAGTLAELQAQVDAFDHIYNTERAHQGLPDRMTPLAAWLATPKADPPRPRPDPLMFAPPKPKRYRPAPKPQDLPAGTHVATLNTAGTFLLAGVRYKVDGHLALEQVLVITEGDNITVADLDGEVLIEHTRPAPGVRYVGNGKPRGPKPKNGPPSPMS